MELNDETWHVVNETAKVTGFVGGNTPVPITDEEIGRITRRVEEGAEKPRPKISLMLVKQSGLLMDLF